MEGFRLPAGKRTPCRDLARHQWAEDIGSRRNPRFLRNHCTLAGESCAGAHEGGHRSDDGSPAMKCGYSREILALYIEDDLTSPEAAHQVESHVAACAECRRYSDQLRQSQSFIKSRFGSMHTESVSQELLIGIRHTVMSQIEPVRNSMGWAVRFERFLMLGLRRPRYAGIAFAVAAIVSASLLGQIRYSAPMPNRSAAVFVAKNTLFCPTDYREWVFVGSCAGHANETSESPENHYNVYIDQK